MDDITTFLQPSFRLVGLAAQCAGASHGLETERQVEVGGQPLVVEVVQPVQDGRWPGMRASRRSGGRD
jgi:hypothetical protein